MRPNISSLVNLDVASRVIDRTRSYAEVSSMNICLHLALVTKPYFVLRKALEVRFARIDITIPIPINSVTADVPP